MIQFKLTEKAKELLEEGINILPERGTTHSAGMDLKAIEAITLLPGQTYKMPLGVHVFLGEGNYEGNFVLEPDCYPNSSRTLRTPFKLAAMLLPRSSNPIGLVLTNTVGLLDNDYQGQLFAKFKNIGDIPIRIETGNAIIQLVVVPVIIDEWQQVESFEETTERGEGGFGSTGNNAVDHHPV